MSKKVIEQLIGCLLTDGVAVGGVYDSTKREVIEQLKQRVANYKQYLKQPKQFDKNHIDYYYFTTMLKDGFDMEMAVKLKYKSKLEKIRLNNKLKELNIKPWEITESVCFPRTNKQGNFRTVKYKGVELIF